MSRYGKMLHGKDTSHDRCTRIRLRAKPFVSSGWAVRQKELRWDFELLCWLWR